MASGDSIPREPLHSFLETEMARVLDLFRYAHLPPRLAQVSKRFCDLAEISVLECPRSAETLWVLRNLLQAKDAAVRAAIETYG